MSITLLRTAREADFLAYGSQRRLNWGGVLDLPLLVKRLGIEQGGVRVDQPSRWLNLGLIGGRVGRGGETEFTREKKSKSSSRYDRNVVWGNHQSVHGEEGWPYPTVASMADYRGIRLQSRFGDKPQKI